MAHEIFRLVNKRLLNKPHLIDEDVLNSLVEYAESRKDLSIGPQSRKPSNVDYLVEDGVAYLPVSGPLTYEASGFEALCGMTSYQGLLAQFDGAVNQGVKTIVLDVDSPGGEAYGAFETGRELRKRADEAGVRLLSYVDGTAASGGYLLASAAHEVIANPQSEVGSVGVVVKLKNANKKEQNEGIETSYVYAGKSKIPFDVNGDFSEDFLSDMQTKVDALYTEFTTYVSEMRGIDEQVVMDTEAKTLMASQALEIGLVDSLLTKEEFFEKLTQSKEGGNQMPLHIKTNGDDKQMSDENLTQPELSTEEVATPEMVDASVVAELTAELDKIKSQLSAEADEKAELLEQARQAELSNLEVKAKGFEFAGVDAKAYAEAAIEGSVPVEMFDAALAQASEKLEGLEGDLANLKSEVEDLGEVGVDTQDVEAPKVDGFNKALSQHATLKNN